MIAAVEAYIRQLGAATSRGWERFWFVPTSAGSLGIIRILAGASTLWAIVAYQPDLADWLDPEGMLPLELVRDLFPVQWSPLDTLPPTAWAPFHLATILLLALLTIGVGGRVVAALALVGTLSFFHRLPLASGRFEAVAAMLLAYLVLGDASQNCAVGRWYRNRRAPANPTTGMTQEQASNCSALNTISQRLIQLHTALIHLMMGTAQLAAMGGVWYSGEGMWLVASGGNSLLDMTGLEAYPRLVALLSHSVTLYLLTFPLGTWHTLWRPLLLAWGLLVWTMVAVFSGDWLFAVAMIAGSLAQVSSVADRPVE
jgi:hypothetical protein